MALRDETIAVDGAELHYESVGRGPAVLAIGGAGPGVLEFRRLARRLARDFRFISYDRRGTLQSTGRTDRALDFGQESRDIVTLLDALGVRQTVVFATCGGASAGFDFIARYPGLCPGLYYPRASHHRNPARCRRAASILPGPLPAERAPGHSGGLHGLDERNRG